MKGKSFDIYVGTKITLEQFCDGRGNPALRAIENQADRHKNSIYSLLYFISKYQLCKDMYSFFY